jgi:hypothetical protein
VNKTSEISSRIDRSRKKRRKLYSCGFCGYVLHRSKVYLDGYIVCVFSCPSCIVTEDVRC